MTAIWQNTAWTDNVQPSKSAIRSGIRDYVVAYFATAAELQGVATSGVRACSVAGAIYLYDSTDTTTADDGINVLVSSDGNRYKFIPNTGGKKDILAAVSVGASATKTITNIPASYAYLKLVLAGISCDTATRHLQLQFSTDNGSTWDTTASQYVGYMVAAGVVSNIGEASAIATADVAAANVFTGSLILTGHQSPGVNVQGRISNGTTNYFANCQYLSGAAINAMRLLWNGSGNFDAGNVELIGMS